MKTKKFVRGFLAVVVALALCLFVRAFAFALSVSPTATITVSGGGVSEVTAVTQETDSGDVILHEVRFVDWNDTVLSEQMVADGAGAQAPLNPVREGYTFTGWDLGFGSVTGNLTVRAQYEINNTTGNSKFLATIGPPDPNAIKIYTAQDLDNVRKNLSGSYVLMNDIDLSTFNGGQWVPIGYELSNSFIGIFDGQGHVIKNESSPISVGTSVLGVQQYHCHTSAALAISDYLCFCTHSPCGLLP